MIGSHEPPVQPERLLARMWHLLDGDPALLDRVRFTGPPGTLPSRLPVTAFAQATVAAASLAAAELAAVRAGAARQPSRPVPTGAAAVPAVTVDSRATAVAFTSERQLRVNGEHPGLWDPLSRFLPAADGWVRLHGNYPHHRDRLYAALGVRPNDPDPADAVMAAVASLPAGEVEDLVTARGGIAAAVREPDEWRAHPQGAAAAAAPLVELSRGGDAPRHRRPAAPGDPLLPAAGIRVLDLTRVIAGPVATRTLALLGADVLRVDPPGLPEIEVQHQDTGFGKRSALLDLAAPADRATFERLLAGADVVVSGYRTGALDRYGLAPDAMLARFPGLVVASHNAWGPDGPWADRRGFDSIVQAASGIARIEAAGAAEPGVMPAQALDHGTGYLIAAAVLRALASQATDGGGWHARLSLAGAAAWLISEAGGPPTASPAGPAAGAPLGARAAATALAAPDADAIPGPGGDATLGSDGVDSGRYLAETGIRAGTLTYALPPVRLEGGPVTWAAPPVPWGSSPAAWRSG